MKTLYTISKDKTLATGFWKSDNKVYIDHIIETNINSYGVFISECHNLFNNGEKAVFYIENDKAYIKSNTGEVQTLKHKIVIQEKHLKAKYIKALLNQHEGFTVYRKNQGFIIVIYKG